MLLEWLKGRKPEDDYLLGLDISSTSIKYVELSSDGRRARLESFASAVLPVGAMVKGEVKDAEAISDILKEILHHEHVKTRRVVIAVPRSSVIFKMISVDSRLKPSEIESRVWIEADHQFPELIGGIYLDYKILGKSNADSNQLDLVLVACRKEQVDPYLNVLKQANLFVESADVSSYALKRSFLFSMREQLAAKTVALFNLDLENSSLVVLRNGELLYAHDHGFDGARLMSKAQEYLYGGAVKVEETDALSPKAIADDDPVYLEILRENLIAQLRHIMHFFYSSRPNVTVDQMVLAGDCMSLPKLAHYIQKEINIETQVVDPFSNVEISSEVDREALNKTGFSLMLAAGLSIVDEDHINLLPWRERAKQLKKKQFILTSAMVGIVAFVVMVFIHFYLFSLVMSQSARTSYLESEISTERKALDDLANKKQNEIELKKKLAYLVGLQKKSNHVVSLLDEIAKVIPGTVQLTLLKTDSDTIVLEGLAQSDLDITWFMQKIAASRIFETPILTDISTKNVTREGEKSFQLKIKYQT